MWRLHRPELSRRIYARRAVGSGVLCGLAGIIHVLSIEPGHLLTLWLTVPATVFAMGFTAFLSEAVISSSASVRRGGRIRPAVAYPIVFLLSPIAAPAVLIVSALQFVRATR